MGETDRLIVVVSDPPDSFNFARHLMEVNAGRHAKADPAANVIGGDRPDRIAMEAHGEPIRAIISGPSFTGPSLKNLGRIQPAGAPVPPGQAEKRFKEIPAWLVHGKVIRQIV